MAASEIRSLRNALGLAILISLSVTVIYQALALGSMADSGSVSADDSHVSVTSATRSVESSLSASLTGFVIFTLRCPGSSPLALDDAIPRNEARETLLWQQAQRSARGHRLQKPPPPVGTAC